MFPGANAEEKGAAYTIVGAPLDATASFRPGARFGPRAIRHAVTHFEDYDPVTGTHFSDLDVHDAGDVPASPDVEGYLKFLTSTLRGFVFDDAVPLVLGGEHTVTLANVRATDADTYVALDAHLDLRETYDELSLSHATVARRVREHVDDVVILGARSGNQQEWDLVDDPDITVVPPDEVDGWSPRGERGVYLSVDIDAVDPGFAPATGTPEPYGLPPSVVRDVVDRLAGAAVGFDVVEVADWDDGETASLAGKLVRRFVFSHADAAGSNG